MNKTGLGKDDEVETVSKKLHVKYMVSLRCKSIVKSEIEKLGLAYKFLPHGGIEFSEGIPEDQFGLLNKNLTKSGMVLLSESESKLIDEIIHVIVEVIHYSDSLPKLSFADFISEYAGSGSESILKIFSDVKGMSVLQFIVIQKIERAKELMLYENMPFPEIAELLNYKNLDFFLAQFKKVTGLKPAYYMHLKKERMEIAKQHSKSNRSDASEVEIQSNF